MSTRANICCDLCGTWEGCETCERDGAAVERRAVVAWLREQAYQAAVSLPKPGEPVWESLTRGRVEAFALRAAADAIEAGHHPHGPLCAAAADPGDRR